jgi:hypothetical protein
MDIPIAVCRKKGKVKVNSSKKGKKKKKKKKKGKVNGIVLLPG